MRPILPDAALARFRALDSSGVERGSFAARVAAWIEGLRARALVSGGRLGDVAIAVGLYDVAALAACVDAQLDAGPVADDTLAHDLASDHHVVGRRGELATLERLSLRMHGLAWLGNVDDIHVALAERRLSGGDEAGAEAVLERVAWHGELLRWLERHAALLEPARRARLAARTHELLERSHLESEYYVDVLCRLALACDDERWLAEARTIVAALAPERLACTPDYAHPLEDLAWVRACRGDLEGALADAYALAPQARWSALQRLLPRVPKGPTRAAMLDALVGLVEPLDAAWSWLVEAAPELGERAFVGIMAIADPARRFDELAAALRHLPGSRQVEACAWLLAHARTLELGTRAASSAWDVVLEQLVTCGAEALLDDASRGALLDAALVHDEIASWPALVHFVPDDRVAPLLELACAHLDAADHYFDRNAWIAFGRPLAARVAPGDPLVERFAAAAIRAKVLTPIERLDDLEGFDLAQRRTIVLARLAQHQHEFLPRQTFVRWLLVLGWSLPADWLAAVATAIPADVRARQREAAPPPPEPVADAARPALAHQLAAWLRDPAWPDAERVVEVFVALARLDGHAALELPLAALVAPLDP